MLLVALALAIVSVVDIVAVGIGVADVVDVVGMCLCAAWC